MFLRFHVDEILIKIETFPFLFFSFSLFAFFSRPVILRKRSYKVKRKNGIVFGGGCGNTGSLQPFIQRRSFESMDTVRLARL